MTKFVSVATTGAAATSTGLSGSVAIPYDSSRGRPRFVRVSATAPMYVAAGDYALVAVPGDMMIQPSDSVILNVAGCAYIAYKSVSGSASLNVQALEDGRWDYPGELTQLGKVLMGAAFATSPRRLRSDYLGPAMRVRRSSDNAEADIAFLANGDLDVYGLMNHVGGENLLTYSEQFDNAVWPISGFFVSPNSVIAPDGTLTADTITSVSGNAALARSCTATSTSQCYSYFVRAGSWTGPAIILRNATTATILASATIDAVNGTLSAVVGNCTIKNWGNGWFRVTAASATGITVGDTLNLYFGAGGAVAVGLYSHFWGAQLNTGTTPRDYCRTTSAPTVDGSGFVTTMYDQSGNGRNLTQSTASAQPRIVNAGVIDRMSTGTARPMLRTDGVSQKMATGAFAVAQPFTRSSAIELLNVGAAGYQDILTSAGNFPNTTLYLNAGVIGMYAGTNAPLKTGAVTGDALTSVEIYNGARSVGSINGAALAVSPDGAGISGIQIGAGIDGICSIKYGDVIIFPSALSTADRQSLEASQKSYYGTP